MIQDFIAKQLEELATKEKDIEKAVGELEAKSNQLREAYKAILIQKATLKNLISSYDQSEKKKIKEEIEKETTIEEELEKELKLAES